MSLELAALLFRVGDITCALPAAHVVETMRLLPVTRLDRMPPYMLGVATIRGAATPVMHLAILLGQPAGDGGRLVTVRAGSGVVALAVDAVIGLDRIPADDLRRRAPLLSEGGDGLVQSLAAKDAALYLVLDSARIVDLAQAGA